ncbi:MAG: hypothetical protein ACLPX9_12480 [Rhodomicrobium sp.]
MVVAIQERTRRDSIWGNNYPITNLLALWAIMSKREDIRKLWERDELTPNQKFDAYLEGLLLSFDFYPVCNRRFLTESDANSLLEDFWVVSADVNRGVKELLDEPRNDQEREQRAARRALEAIRRAYAKRTNE